MNDTAFTYKVYMCSNIVGVVMTMEGTVTVTMIDLPNAGTELQ